MPLSDEMAAFVVLVTDSGGARWVWAVLLFVLGLLMLDARIPLAQRGREVAVLVVVMSLVLPLCAEFNERIVKTKFRQARPSHRMLAQAGELPPPQEFYALDVAARRALLHPLEEESARAALAVRLQRSPRVVEVWVHEVSPTFPSGHAWNAFLAATIVVLVTASRPTRWRRGVVALLLVWAVAVGWSRVLLEVHRPIDVVAGAALGLLVGIPVGLTVVRLTRRPRQTPVR